MRLLITGGNGMLARALTQALGNNNEIRALDAAFIGDLPPNIEQIEGDIRDVETVRRALDGVDVVVHLAPLYPAITSSPVFDAENDTLDQATRGTYVLLTEMQKAGVKQLVLGSTLALFDVLPPTYHIDERWRPRPLPNVKHLGPWLAELSARECVRVSSICAACLRFGNLIEEAEEAASDPLALSLEDAVHGLLRALDWVGRQNTASFWRIFHITPAGADSKIRLSSYTHQALGYEPQHPSPPRLDSYNEWREQSYMTASRPVRNVVIFGAGGPVAAAVTQELASSYHLRLTDARSLEEIAAENKPQSPGAPVAAPLPRPHETRVVDVRDPVAVRDACHGMDAIINCTVVRPDPVEAFRVNTLGAYNIMQAAIAHNIRRVVQTGPQMVDVNEGAGFSWDYDVPGDAPPRPGTQLYFHTKYLGQEICRVFAEYYGMEVPVLLFCLFFNPESVTSINDFYISWGDSARAIRSALQVPFLPSAYEIVNVLADTPHGRYSNARAKSLLCWQPRDNFHHLWDKQER